MLKDTCLRQGAAQHPQKLGLQDCRTAQLLNDRPKKHTQNKLLRTVHQTVQNLSKNPIKRFYMSLQTFGHENRPKRSYEQKVMSI